MLREMTADILGVDCYLSDYNEPIMGLYYLIYGRQTTPAPIETIALSLENHEQYTEVFKNYFSK
jgi:gluconokinase